MKRLGLALAGLCFALSVVEVGLRIIGPALWEHRVEFAPFDWLVYDPILAWKNRANYERPGLRINSLGLRGDEIAARKPSGVLRIICLGDSRTFGIWLDLHQMRFDNDYPSALAALIAQDAGVGRVEVVNAALIGYSSSHGLRQLMTQVIDLQPDIIVVGFGFNDHSLAWNTALRNAEPRSLVWRTLLYGLHDLRLLQLGFVAEQAITRLHPAPYSIHWAERDEYAYNLRRFAEVSRRHGLRLLFLSQSLRSLDQGDSPPAFPEHGQEPKNPYVLSGASDLADLHRLYQTYQDVLYRVAQEEQIPMADAAAAFAQHSGDPLFGAYDAVHVNVAGGRLIGATVREKLSSLGWLDRHD